MEWIFDNIGLIVSILFWGFIIRSVIKAVKKATVKEQDARLAVEELHQKELGLKRQLKNKQKTAKQAAIEAEVGSSIFKNKKKQQSKKTKSNALTTLKPEGDCAIPTKHQMTKKHQVKVSDYVKTVVETGKIEVEKLSAQESHPHKPKRPQGANAQLEVLPALKGKSQLQRSIILAELLRPVG